MQGQFKDVMHYSTNYLFVFFISLSLLNSIKDFQKLNLLHWIEVSPMIKWCGKKYYTWWILKQRHLEGQKRITKFDIV